MEHAFDALAEGRESLMHIGDELGFSAQSHFTRFFKQHQGVSPSLYRQQVEKAPKLDS
jgi:AraC-like DNA-binding protein